MNREDFESSFEQARKVVEITRDLVVGNIAGATQADPSHLLFLTDMLDTKMEEMQVEIENWPQPEPEPEPPPLPPLTEAEVALDAQITETLRAAIPRLQQRNLDNGVLLAQQAARGEGNLVEHFAELGRRFGGERAQAGLS